MIESAIARNDDPFSLLGMGNGNGITEQDIQIVLDNMDLVHYTEQPSDPALGV